MDTPDIGLVLLAVLCFAHAQNIHLVQELTSSSNSSGDSDHRPSCVLINNYCGKVVPGTEMKKECCGDLICYKNKCRRRTCC